MIFKKANGPDNLKNVFKYTILSVWVIANVWLWLYILVFPIGIYDSFNSTPDGRMEGVSQWSDVIHTPKIMRGVSIDSYRRRTGKYNAFFYDIEFEQYKAEVTGTIYTGDRPSFKVRVNKMGWAITVTIEIIFSIMIIGGLQHAFRSKSH